MTSTSLQPQQLPPGVAGQPYIIESLGGEIIYIPASKSNLRLVVTGKETEDAFCVVTTGGIAGDPIGFHYHREAHDVFLCLKGAMNVWAGDQCRTLEPGDICSVPPNTIHQYQLLGPYTEGAGLIFPGGWEEFLRFISEPYVDGPLFPLIDDRNAWEVVEPRIMQASQKFDMVPARKTKYFEPQPWVEGKDNVLPGVCSPFFLKSSKGPTFLTGGLVIKPLITPAESAHKFCIASVEGTSWHKNSPLEQSFKFTKIHHALHVVEGAAEVTLDGKKSQLATGECGYIPKGTSFSLRLTNRYTKIYVYTNGLGIADLLRTIGKPYDQLLPPEKAEEWNLKDVEKLKTEWSFQIA